MRRRARTDANQQAVIDALRQAKATVQSLAEIGNGCPDLLVGYNGRTYLMEVKDGSKPLSGVKLTANQIEWHQQWTGGTLSIVYGPEGALKIIGALQDMRGKDFKVKNMQLTDEQIKQIYRKLFPRGAYILDESVVLFANKVLEAAGIVQQDEQ